MEIDNWSEGWVKYDKKRGIIKGKHSYQGNEWRSGTIKLKAEAT